eukprot:scaffold1411_cov396-Prasinococcus_capsulatus_cf.AAC.22
MLIMSDHGGGLTGGFGGDITTQYYSGYDGGSSGSDDGSVFGMTMREMRDGLAQGLQGVRAVAHIRELHQRAEPQ